MLTVAIAFILMPIAASAQSSGATIDLSDGVTTTGNGWTYSANVFTIDGTYAVTITGTTTTSRVVVSGNVDIALDNVNITSGGVPINCGTYTVNITLVGTNTLAGQGVYVSGLGSTGNLTISGDNTAVLTVSCANGTQAIGGGGTVTINGGVINLTAGNTSSCINAGNVIINGGTVTTYADPYGTGIASGTIVITGGSCKIYGSSASFSSAPTNGLGANVYLNTLTVGSAANANMAVTAGSINGAAMEAVVPPVTGYGIKDVKTDADGKVYFYLPASGGSGANSEVVSVTVGGGEYAGSYPRNTSAQTQTLSLLSNIIDVESAATVGAGWSFAAGVYTITGGANVTITGTTTTSRVVITGDADITLDNTDIQVTNGAPIDCGANTVTFTLSGTNILRVSSYAFGCAGLQANGGHIIINGTAADSLTATGRFWGYQGSTDSGAGIGGSGNNRVTINGGVITATAGSGHSADIGASSGGTSTVVINGGTVFTTGSIGTGSVAGSIGTVIINGGSVKANSISGTPKNGVGEPLYLNTLTVNGVDNAGELLTSGSINGVNMNETPNAAAGSYGLKDIKTDAEGKVYLWLPTSGNEGKTNEIISVTSEDGNVYTADYSRGEKAVMKTMFTTSGIFTKTIDVSNATVTKGDGWGFKSGVFYISGGAAGIILTGTTATNIVRVTAVSDDVTYITLEDLDIPSSSGGAPIDCGANTVNVTLVGTNVLRSTGGGQAGLQANDGHIIIDGTGSLTTTGHWVNYQGSTDGGAGIGGGSGGSCTVTLNGGVINAAGATSAAGIGGGGRGNGTVFINGGVITATGGAAGIGGGSGTVEINGGSVKANSISGPPKNSAGDPVYLNTLTVGNYTENETDNKQIIAGTINGVPMEAVAPPVTGYGIKDVKTDAAGIVYFYLPISGGSGANSEVVSVTVDGGEYAGNYPRNASAQTQTLSLLSNIIDVESSDAVGSGWSYAAGVYTINSGANVTITGTTTTSRVVVTGDASITLDNVSITSSSGGAPIDCGANTVTFTLVGTNVLKTTVAGYAGLQANGGEIIINGTEADSLESTGGEEGAGIGGGREGGSTVTINGGTINATGDNGWGGGGAAGIGGGYNANGTVTINGGTVTAKSGANSAGIGGGSNASGAVTINGGTITTTGSYVGIGKGNYGAAATITINGGSVKGTMSETPTNGTNPVYLNTLTVGSADNANAAVTAGSVNGVSMEAVAPPSTGYGIKDVKTDAAGIVYFYLPISGGSGANSEVVSVTVGGDTYAGSYPRNTSAQTQTLSLLSNIIDVESAATVGAGWSYAAGVYTINSGANVSITGTTTTSRVVVTGDASITLDNVSITSSSGGAPIDCGANTVNVTLVGANVLTITNGTYPQAQYIYAGLQASGGTLTIGGNGSLEATGGDYGAGIGGGDNGACTVIINGGTINATGGNWGAGIGSGAVHVSATVTINGGTITATGGQYGAGIGCGSGNGIATVTINGGTVNSIGGASAPAGIGKGYNYTTPATIIITGGSVNGTLSDVPTNGTNPIYLNTLTVGSSANANTAVTAGSVNGVNMETVAPPVSGGYGIKDVKTDAAGIVYFYLPASGNSGTYSEVVSVTVGGTAYSDDYVRGVSVANTKTLTLPFTPPTATAVNANASAPRVGTALTGTYTYNAGTGTGAGDESGTTVNWYRGNTNTWGTASPIQVATTASYTPTGADVGKYLYFEVTPSNGILTGAEMQSAASGQAGIVVSLHITANGTTGAATINSGTADVEVYSATAPTAAATLGNAASIAWTATAGSFTNAASTSPGYSFPALNSGVTGPITITATFTATTVYSIAVTTEGLNSLKVGQAVAGTTIIYTLTGSTYETPITAADFTVTGLPAGLTAGTATRATDATVEIAVTGTPTTYSASAATLTYASSIPMANVTGASVDITPSGSISASAVAKGDQTALNITGLAASYTYGDAAVTLGTSGGTTSGTVTYVSNNTNVATVSGNSMSIVGAGTFTVTATMEGNENYNDVSVTSVEVTVNNAYTKSPAISGPETLTLTKGYTATSTEVYTISGAPEPTVSKTSGNDLISWNNSTKCLDIAAGLTANDYVVELTANNGILPNATLTFTLTVNAVNSIEEILAEKLSIYPNPVKDELRIESGELTIKKVEIIDLSGRILIFLQSPMSPIKIANLPNSIYFIKIETDKGIVTRKFVKE